MGVSLPNVRVTFTLVPQNPYVSLAKNQNGLSLSYNNVTYTLLPLNQ